MNTHVEMAEARIQVEALSVMPVAGIGIPRRRRKFSNPKFLTPRGIIEGFPESENDFFLTFEDAFAALKINAKAIELNKWEVVNTGGFTAMQKSQRYIRWLKEARNINYKEPRRSLDDWAAIYRNQGFQAMKTMGTKSYAFNILKKLRSAHKDIDAHYCETRNASHFDDPRI